MQTPNSKWRERFDVHPCCDALPQIDAEGKKALATDLRQHGLKEPIKVRILRDGKEELFDGRSRLDAMELAGIELRPEDIKVEQIKDADMASYVISLNAHRRHLTKAQKAEAIAAIILAAENLANRCEVSEADQKSIADPITEAKAKRAEAKQKQEEEKAEKQKGGRGQKDVTKAKVIEEAAEQGIGRRTAEQGYAAAQGRTPASPKMKPSWNKKQKT